MPAVKPWLCRSTVLPFHSKVRAHESGSPLRIRNASPPPLGAEAEVEVGWEHRHRHRIGEIGVEVDLVLAVGAGIEFEVGGVGRPQRRVDGVADEEVDIARPGRAAQVPT